MNDQQKPPDNPSDYQVRIERELGTRVAEQAAKEERSVKKWVERALRRALEDEDG